MKAATVSERGFWWLSDGSKSNKQLQGESDEQSLRCNKVVQVRSQPAWVPNLPRSLKEKQLYQDTFTL